MKLHELLDAIQSKVDTQPELMDYEILIPVFGKGEHKPFTLSNLEFGSVTKDGSYVPIHRMNDFGLSKEETNAICIR